jgi:hypothetical protein
MADLDFSILAHGESLPFLVSEVNSCPNEALTSSNLGRMCLDDGFQKTPDDGHT